MNSSAVLCPPPATARNHRHTVPRTLGGATANGGTFASVVDIRIARAHIQAPKAATTKNVKLKLMMPYRNHNHNHNHNHKRGYMLPSFAYTCSLLEGAQNSASSSYSSSSLSEHSLVADMGSPQKNTKLLTLPTILTLARVAAVPLFIGTYYVNNWWGTTATTSVFLTAAFTDWLDGYLARKMDLGTAFGAFLDPVADKLMVAATLVLLCSRPPETAILGHFPWLFPVPAIAIIGREITMSAVREWAASQNTELLQAVAVNNLGKWKTATQMAALTILLSTRDSSFAGPGVLVTSGIVLLYISAALAVWSLVIYMRKVWNVLLR